METRDIMSTPVLAVTPSASLAEAAREMLCRGFTSLPVVDAGGRLVGVVDEADLVRAGFPDPARELGNADRRATPAAGSDTVEAVMHTPGVAVPADLDPAELARRMTDAGVRALPVVEHELLVGVVTFQDVLRVLPAAGQP
ncbi:HPP family protein [Amycolatopsis sp. FDAARGOS 1241]|uniref:CBS domain-containing protein n=1 Tax=Amycolatopsis sp. FDAARGOS 1241 TaxID=2778070 RepID=UPI0019500C7A|nr:CBS domain-containing protein [Amycolatopsis sp. FDAARGOS 1241]QRP50360.1 CBS domain-containing protein [Amycolatopsis sp. FDAARGOS 1241]